jgi:hypothetical protein
MVGVVPRAQVEIRVITEKDLDAVHALLCEGFPAREPKYWRRSLTLLSRRQEVAGFPRYGMLLEVAGVVEGIILLLTSNSESGLRTNISSWYVRPAYRKYAIFLFKRALREKSSTYLNISPSPDTLPIVEAIGFKPYTGGMILLNAFGIYRSGGPVSPCGTPTIGMLDAGTRARAEAHLSYGCDGFVLEDAEGPMLALYRVKHLKRLVPAAQFVFGRPEQLLRNSGSVMRALFVRGITIALVDAPPNMTPGAGWLMKKREIRYFKGPLAPEPGDLMETEIAIFGP